MNQVVFEIPVPTTAADGGSLIGAVENTDDRVLRMLWLFFGLTYYSATYFYANELENSS